MKFIAYLTAAWFAGTSFAVAADSKDGKAGQSCSYKVGSHADFIAPADYVATAQKNQAALGADKGEFETTEDFNKRVAAAQKEIGTRPVLVETVQDPSDNEGSIKYDADKKRFKVFVGAWINFLDGVSYTTMDKVVLQKTVNSQDRYVASNAYGQEKVVRREDLDLIAIKSWKTFPKDLSWKYETTEDYAFNVYIPVPPDQAPTFRAGLRAGIEFLPKEPFFSTDVDRVKPELDFPIDMTYNYRQFEGVVLCAVIADRNGNVVKTIQPLIK
ncbi:hypothetical protein E0J20_09230 [Rhizobium leguminosarum bv. viciae]|nr:hypothetical protein E0J20_09230 [Rhizobium leguminosarum bv. viciae]